VGISVEIVIRASSDAVWLYTQDPAFHERWDLRFSTIDYLPRSENEPQRFLYATRIGFGARITGTGESIAQRDRPDGPCASSLKFFSEDPRSIIREGSGYWKYTPTPDGTHFLTWYDYHTRFGRAGAFLDRVAFRPLIAWATAWSFDRLRLWLEEGVPPDAALRCFTTRACARCMIAFVFAYHGLVPKLLMANADEVAMLRDAGVASAWLAPARWTAGIAELVFAIVLLVFWRSRWPTAISLLLMAAATAGVAFNSPRYLAGAFNPVTLNLCVAALCILDIVNFKGAPSAARCRYSSNRTESRSPTRSRGASR
jgi:hypothetical protein